MSDHPSLDVNDVGIIEESFTQSARVFFLRADAHVTLPTEVLTAFEISDTGDLCDLKVCDRCFKRLNTEEYFSNNRHKKDGWITKRPSCKACRKLKDGKAIPRITKEIWEAQRPPDYTIFECPICHKSSIVGITKIVLDHCHLTGSVRGYTCESCNTGIGRFDDNIDIVLNAAKWLKKMS